MFAQRCIQQIHGFHHWVALGKNHYYHYILKSSDEPQPSFRSGRFPVTGCHFRRQVR